MNNKLYKILKYIALIALPIVTAFILAIAIIWKVQNNVGIALILVGLNSLLGITLCISSHFYEKMKKLERDYKELDEEYRELYLKLEDRSIQKMANFYDR